MHEEQQKLEGLAGSSKPKPWTGIRGGGQADHDDLPIELPGEVKPTVLQIAQENQASMLDPSADAFQPSGDLIDPDSDKPKKSKKKKNKKKSKKTDVTNDGMANGAPPN